jgi:dTDP-glucose pyrophosphorylase
MSTHKAVVMARGLGTRMRRDDNVAVLDTAQTAAADEGLKTMMPFGAPFLDYVLNSLADAGFTRVCLVIGPEHEAVRRRYSVERRPARIEVVYAIQERPLGTADAVAAAGTFAAGGDFVVVNGDNLYPVESLRALREVDAPAVSGFTRRALVSKGNFDADRVDRFSLLPADATGRLVDVIEKPDPAVLAAAGPDALIGMNSWAFDDRILRACAEVTPSPRGEFELQDAVRLAIKRFGASFKVLPFSLPVFDLSHRSDVPSMARVLSTVQPRF